MQITRGRFAAKRRLHADYTEGETALNCRNFSCYKTQIKVKYRRRICAHCKERLPKISVLRK